MSEGRSGPPRGKKDEHPPTPNTQIYGDGEPSLRDAIKSLKDQHKENIEELAHQLYKQMKIEKKVLEAIGKGLEDVAIAFTKPVNTKQSVDLVEDNGRHTWDEVIQRLVSLIASEGLKATLLFEPKFLCSKCKLLVSKTSIRKQSKSFDFDRSWTLTSQPPTNVRSPCCSSKLSVLPSCYSEIVIDLTEI